MNEQMTEAITTTRTLGELESVIERGLQTFVEVGAALKEISEGKLYREQGFSTFEDYCKQRWGWERRQAYNYIAATEVAENVQSTAHSIPSLSQAAELSVLEPEQQREVASRIDFANTTVRELKEEIQRVKEPADPIAAKVAVSDQLKAVGETLEEPTARLGVHFSSESEEWYTPPKIIELSLKVLGEIDLDPCSDAGSNIPATNRFTKEDDGLTKPWAGHVYMNPPYGRAIVGWAEKLCEEYARGSVTSAIALVPARVDTDWFRLFRDFAVCFIDGRLKFSGHENSAPFPSAVIYLGKDIESFNAAFSGVGDVWIRFGRSQRICNGLDESRDLIRRLEALIRQSEMQAKMFERRFTPKPKPGKPETIN